MFAANDWKPFQSCFFNKFVKIPFLPFLQMYKDYQPWTGAKILKLILLIFRYLFWYVFVEIALHFFYFSAIRYEPKVVERLDLWTLCGLGYSMGQFFCIKYVFFYGFTRPFVMADGIDPPNHPKCIGRIHLYSDMWRFFDQGLHRFMHRYMLSAAG
jgi:hypothetical protein